MLGLARLARFRAEGLAEFSATPAAFMNSLAPLLAIPAAGGLLLLTRGDFRAAAVNLLVSLVAVLAPLAMSHFIALEWDREPRWLRFAVAFNWSQIAITVLLIVTFTGVAAGTSDRPDGPALTLAAAAGVVAYWMVYCVFLVRRALDLSLLLAIAFVLLMNAATGVLVMLPRALMGLESWPGAAG